MRKEFRTVFSKTLIIILRCWAHNPIGIFYTTKHNILYNNMKDVGKIELILILLLKYMPSWCWPQRLQGGGSLVFGLGFSEEYNL
jgi:hypothetical protein